MKMKKFKCKKIKNVDKQICTAEQKIAYNFAFMWVDIGKKIKASDNAEFAKSELYHTIEKSVLNSLRDEKFNKYNLDAIIVAFRNGFRKYCENYFIAADYKCIGECFEIPYEIV